MARTRNATKRQKVESALFNPDVVFLLAALLDARDLCQMTLTCKAMGGKQANYSNVSLVEEAARLMFEQASSWERSCLPKYDDEGWIELYHHLLMLRSKLTLDQLVGVDGVQYREAKLSVGTSALCSNHVMRAGSHFAVFSGRTCNIGLVRPVQINRSDLDDRELRSFSLWGTFGGYLRGQITERWNDSEVHCCGFNSCGEFVRYDWTSNDPYRRRTVHGFNHNIPFGLLLDLDRGTLSVYQNGGRVALLVDGLSGEYCWFAYAGWGDARGSASFTIERDLSPDE